MVPAYVRFGKDVYRDQVDINGDEFYRKLLNDPIHPTTEPPTPQDFADAYRKLSQEADGIISIHVSGKLSATYNSALLGKEILKPEFPIEVVDSQQVTLGLGLLVIAAHSLAGSEKSLLQVVEKTKQTIPAIHLRGIFDTLKYLALGGRVSEAKALLGSVLSVKPLLVMKDGELEPAGRVRIRAKGIDELTDFIKSATDIQDLAIVHSTTPDEAQELAERIGSVFPKDRVKLVRLGPTL